MKLLYSSGRGKLARPEVPRREKAKNLVSMKVPDMIDPSNRSKVHFRDGLRSGLPWLIRD